MFQLILPFQLEFPFEGPEVARGAQNGRVRRARVRGPQGRALSEVQQAMSSACSRTDPLVLVASIAAEAD